MAEDKQKNSFGKTIINGAKSFLGSTVGGAIVNGAIGFGQSIFNKHLAEKSAESQYQRQLDFWNKQNAYNSPSAQRQRFQAAGINPNSVTGEMASSGAAQGLSSVPGNEYAQSGVLKLEAFAQTLEIMSRIEKLGAETGLITQQISTEALQQTLLGLGIEREKVQYLIDQWEEKGKSLEFENLPAFFEHRNKMYDLDEAYRRKEFDFLDASITEKIASADYTEALTLTENVMRDAKKAYQNAITDEARQNIAHSVAQQSLVPLMATKIERETGLILSQDLKTDQERFKLEQEVLRLMDTREFNKIIQAAGASEAEANAVIAEIESKQHSLLADNLSGGTNILDYLANLADSIIFNTFAKD